MSPLVNKSSDLDRKLRLDEAPPEYPRIQPKTARDKVKSWSGKESHGEEEEEEENEVDKKALQEVDLSRESFLAAMREDPH